MQAEVTEGTLAVGTPASGTVVSAVTPELVIRAPEDTRQLVMAEAVDTLLSVKGALPLDMAQQAARHMVAQAVAPTQEQVKAPPAVPTK